MSYSVFRSLPSHFLIPTLAIAVLALIGGCSSTSEEGPTGPTAPTGPLPFETVEQSQVEPEAVEEGGKFEEEMVHVIRDQSEFESFWQDLHGANVEAPSVDFSEKLVVAAILGKRPNDGYEAKIASITKNTNPTGVRVFVTEVKPGSNCTVSGSSVIPYHIVKMDRFSTEQVNFVDNGTETKDCE